MIRAFFGGSLTVNHILGRLLGGNRSLCPGDRNHLVWRDLKPRKTPTKTNLFLLLYQEKGRVTPEKLPQIIWTKKSTRKKNTCTFSGISEWQTHFGRLGILGTLWKNILLKTWWFWVAMLSLLIYWTDLDAWTHVVLQVFNPPPLLRGKTRDTIGLDTTFAPCWRVHRPIGWVICGCSKLGKKCFPKESKPLRSHATRKKKAGKNEFFGCLVNSYIRILLYEKSMTVQRVTFQGFQEI